MTRDPTLEPAPTEDLCEDLGGLIAAAIDQARAEGEEEPFDSLGGGLQLTPTLDHGSSAAVENDEASVREALSAARLALRSGQLDHARASVEAAASISPHDSAVTSVRDSIAEHERKVRDDSRRQRRAGLRRWTRLVGFMALAVTGTGMVSWTALRDRGPDLPDESAAFAEVAPFRGLVRAPGGGWRAKIAEPLGDLDMPARMERCEEIARQLPQADVPALVVRGNDGVSIACLR